MSRIRLLVLFFATLIVVEPVVHTHPLAPTAHDGDGTSTVCACAAGTSLTMSIAPAIGAPATFVVETAVATTDTLSRGIALTLPSRAPPAN